jgi:hypothetical protein
MVVLPGPVPRMMEIQPCLEIAGNFLAIVVGLGAMK